MELVLELRPPESRHYPSWRDRLTAVARLRQPDRLHALCEEAYVRGTRAILAIVDEPIREALLAFQRWRDAAVWAVVPNMFAFIRDLTDLGMVGAARARFLRLAPADMLRQGAAALGRLQRVLRKDCALCGSRVSSSIRSSPRWRSQAGCASCSPASPPAPSASASKRAS